MFGAAAATGSSALVGVVLSVLGLVLAAFSLLLSMSRARTGDVVSVAERLTALEQRSVPANLAERLANLEQHISAPERLAERLSTLEEQARSADYLALLSRLVQTETKIDLFWRGLSVDAARVLHSPKPELARRDYLLEAFMAHRMSVAEVRELTGLLTGVLNDHDSDAGERMAAAVVLKYLHLEYALTDGPDGA